MVAISINVYGSIVVWFQGISSDEEENQEETL